MQNGCKEHVSKCQCEMDGESVSLQSRILNFGNMHNLLNIVMVQILLAGKIAQ